MDQNFRYLFHIFRFASDYKLIFARNEFHQFTTELATYKRTGTDQYPPELFQLAASQVPLGRAVTSLQFTN
jgi:hypothetical protein